MQVFDISYDFCSNKKGSEPSWQWAVAGTTYDTVGTNSAGLIAMKAGNNLCGVGVAPDARIAGRFVTFT